MKGRSCYTCAFIFIIIIFAAVDLFDPLICLNIVPFWVHMSLCFKGFGRFCFAGFVNTA